MSEPTPQELEEARQRYLDAVASGDPTKLQPGDIAKAARMVDESLKKNPPKS